MHSQDKTLLEPLVGTLGPGTPAGSHQLLKHTQYRTLLEPPVGNIGPGTPAGSHQLQKHPQTRSLLEPPVGAIGPGTPAVSHQLLKLTQGLNGVVPFAVETFGRRSSPAFERGTGPIGCRRGRPTQLGFANHTAALARPAQLTAATSALRGRCRVLGAWTSLASMLAGSRAALR
jgi:predicted RNA binding protein YcfA (HicA-like mRNA interferase family)